MTRILASLAAVAVLAGPLAASAQPAPAAPAAPAAPPPAAAPAAPSIPQIQPAGDIAATLKASGQFTILLKALEASNLTSLVAQTSPLTIVAPTDAAFNALPPGTVDNLLKPDNAAQLQALLLNHIIHARVGLSNIQGSTPVDIPNVSNGKLRFDATTPTIKVDGGNVVAMGTGSNGDIYAVDKVIQPGA
jgi:uncharacterized surface protein with fasciclin (FAS1) repeats